MNLTARCQREHFCRHPLKHETKVIAADRCGCSGRHTDRRQCRPVHQRKSLPAPPFLFSSEHTRDWGGGPSILPLADYKGVNEGDWKISRFFLFLCDFCVSTILGSFLATLLTLAHNSASRVLGLNVNLGWWRSLVQYHAKSLPPQVIRNGAMHEIGSECFEECVGGFSSEQQENCFWRWKYILSKNASKKKSESHRWKDVTDRCREIAKTSTRDLISQTIPYTNKQDMNRGCTIRSDGKDEGRKKDCRWERNATALSWTPWPVCSVLGPPVTCS